jgi:hypothetical protein
MRTTVTLDPDVAAKLKQVARERGESFKAVLNAAVRAGLGAGGRSTRRYSMPARRMGVRPTIDLDHALRLAGQLQDEETVRKLALRK